MTPHTSHSHDHHHDEGGADHGSYRSYLTGFGLSIVLTIIPFAAVMQGWFDSRMMAVALVSAFAVAQIMVHMVFFLHMNPRSEGGWTMLALIFTLILVVIAISGTLWVMYHMNSNMMPHHLPEG
ncbi:cytochrome o ubiquinol oxidase subunit IV [Pseudogemmobacter sonorensis]|uniref:cytochrome o ubiquinol oxidase subunit IV n=1 Tax=Pseudogemmobacter sonorensis TaxID=2989681 RepID=UPI00369144D1